MRTRRLTLIGLDMIGEVQQGDDLAHLLLAAIAAAGERLQEGDIVAVAQKIVSKAEGRMVRLADVVPSEGAQALAALSAKDPRLCQMVLSETREIVRQRRDLVIVEDLRGLVLANAGIDASNVSAEAGMVLLLPEDPDASAQRLRESIALESRTAPGVVVIDSIGRAWRQGTIGTAIGVAGIAALLDLRGRPDMYGRLLETSELAIADEIAAAASLVMGQTDERCPAVLVRGLTLTGAGTARDLLRPREKDLFR